MVLFESNRAHWPAEGTIFPISEIDVRVAAEPHPFHLAEREQARENWRWEIAAKPDLFDGRMLLQRTIQIEGGRIAARAHIVPYSTFLWWRKTRGLARDEEKCARFSARIAR